MNSGRQTLASIDRALQGAREQVQATDVAMQRTTADLADRRRREAELYAKLARERLARLDAGALGALDEANRSARKLLAERESALKELTAAVADAQARQTTLETSRQAQNEVVEAAEAALETCLADAEKTLGDQPEYQDKVAEAQQADEVVERAAEKTAQAENDRQVKGRPYEQDALFMYLWERGYGTSQYRAWPLSRFVDGLVARHIRFEPARRNFYLLNEIPRRLQAHTERLRAAADIASSELDAVERAAAVAAGAVPLEEQLARRRQELEAIDSQIGTEESRFADLMRQREAFASGTDRYLTEALEVVVASLREEPLRQLREEAESTAGPGDDALVNELIEVRDRTRALEDSLKDSRLLHERHFERIRGLEEVRRRFKQSRYDSGESQFDDSGRLAMMLEQYLLGMLNADVLWQTIRHAQTFRQILRHSGMGGAGGFRLPRLPRGRTFGGGGFRTGGGM